MSLRFSNLSLKFKIVILMMAIVLGALALSSGGLLFYEFGQLKAEKIQHSTALANVTADNSVAALAFSDTRAAEEVLNALHVQDDIIQAVLFDKDGKVFARYARNSQAKSSNFLVGKDDGTIIGAEDFQTRRTIKLEGETVGQLVVQTDLSHLKSDLRHFVLIVLAIMSCALLLALILSSYFQNIISRPVLALATLARTVSENGDYSLRAEVKSSDEIGSLTEGLNQMLAEVEKRESALQLAHDTLEDRVRERTFELEEEVAIRKAVETALRREQELLLGVINNAPVAMAMFDSNMNYLAHSNQWLIDYSLTEKIIGRSHYEIFPDLPAHWRGIHDRALRGEIITCAEDLLERADGQRLYLRWALHPWWRPDGSQGGVIMVTDRIDALVHAREEALRVAQAKSQFFANVSHELRTPLNGVLGFTELLADTSLTGDQRGYLDVIKSSARYLLSLIDDILDFAKVESTKFELEQAPFDLIESLTSVTTLLRPVAEHKKIELRLLIDSSVPKIVVGDTLRLQQIFLNLIGNAIKFTTEGHIEVSARAEFGANGKVTLRAAVKDTGVGISEDKIHKIFYVFAQADGSTTRKYGGTGLGLAICLQLIELMRGTIKVESEVDRGSAFIFHLELTQAEANDQPEPATLQRPASVRREAQETDRANRPVRILVAEDNSVNQKLISTILTKRGFVLTLVDNGEEAVIVAKDTAFDLILMDLQMPELGGIEAATLIRQGLAPLNVATPIIALTANAFEEDRLRCIAAGMDDYLSKPINTTLLLEMIQHWLNGPGVTERL